MNHVTPELENWMRFGERGVSSETMAEVFAGFPFGFLSGVGAGRHPHDPADFRRCFLFLKAVPEMRPRLGEMKQVSPEWAALVEHWTELEQLYREESKDGRRCTELNFYMKKLIAKAQLAELISEIGQEGFTWHFHYGTPSIRVGDVTINRYPTVANIRHAFEMAKECRHNL